MRLEQAEPAFRDALLIGIGREVHAAGHALHDSVDELFLLVHHRHRALESDLRVLHPSEPNMFVRRRVARASRRSHVDVCLGGRGLGGSQPHFGSDSGPLWGPVPASATHHKPANPPKSLRTRRDSNP
jgi:hypothetical protein